ncbi:phage/plasmid replication domain-containing protein [Rummeliibacillus pycnus]|uniref:phage/plasmid replication domain-containing protein n=1 Tax=Rummeliibacillus pycnus TaxID=101070 RepID=UPI000C9ADD55|nr:phage/plasmid replication protein [Rummeliibacillus pycnus]
MVHTLSILIDLEPEHLHYFEMVHRHKSCNVVMRQYNRRGLHFILYRKNKLACSIFVDVVEILGRTLVKESDYTYIKKYLINCLSILFNDENLFFEHNLTRFDFSFNAYIPNAKIRQQILKLLKKLPGAYRRMQQNNSYKTSMLYKSKSVEVIVYDKVAERLAKQEKIRSYEKDMLRVEVKLSNAHIYRQCHRHGKPKQLFTFLHLFLFEKYFEQYFLNFIHCGDYYTSSIAFKKIMKSTLKEKEKTKLIQLLERINKEGIDKVKSSYNPKTFRKWMTYLDTLKINPILIPDTAGIIHIHSLQKYYFNTLKKLS